MPDTTRRPNIVFMLVDDLGQRDLGCYGSTFYETPNIDRLARDGMLFHDAYAACPVCSPTRASILSGRYPARLGLTQYIGSPEKGGRLLTAPFVDRLSLDNRSLAAALRGHGYQTWHVGKWHLGPEPCWPEHHGFDVNIGGCDTGAPGRGGYFSPWTIPVLAGADVPDGTYLDDYLTDRAVALIRDRDPGRPFYLDMSFYLVHTPIQSKPGLVEHFRAKARRLHLDETEPLVPGERFPCLHKRDQRVVRRLFQSDPVYAGMVRTLDDEVGRLMGALDRFGLADNTIVVFMSDNGGLSSSEGSPTCNAPLAEGKGWMYEGGTRAPLLVRWPGVTRAGSTCDEPVTSTDFYPTLLDAAALPPEPAQHADGISFVPLLREPAARLGREAIFWHYPHYGNQGGTPGSSVRAGDWKLIEFFEDGRLELYNLRDDPGEARNLAASEPGRTRRLHDRLRAWREEMGAVIPQPNPGYTPPADPLADPRV